LPASSTQLVNRSENLARLIIVALFSGILLPVLLTAF
jgi:hypothetical protein